MSPHTQAASADVPPGNVRVRGFLPVDDRRSRLTPLLSLLLHVAAIVLLVRLGVEEAETRGGPLSTLLEQLGGGGGGGQGGAEYVMLQAPPPPPPPPEVVVEAPIVTPTVIPPVEQTTIKPEVTPPPARPDTLPSGGGASAGSGGGSGGGQGTGNGPGTGSGEGPGSGGGRGGGTGGGTLRGTPPETKFLIIPPMEGTPRALRGTTIEVTFQIAANGVVTSIDHPPISDKKFQKKFDDLMMGYTFKPARDADGRAVAGVLLVTVTFPDR